MIEIVLVGAFIVGFLVICAAWANSSQYTEERDKKVLKNVGIIWLTIIIWFTIGVFQKTKYKEIECTLVSTKVSADDYSYSYQYIVDENGEQIDITKLSGKLFSDNSKVTIRKPKRWYCGIYFVTLKTKYRVEDLSFEEKHK